MRLLPQIDSRGSPRARRMRLKINLNQCFTWMQALGLTGPTGSTPFRHAGPSRR
jgi:hypothetical protein